MCGIVGYLGEREPKDVILKGLKALEYRGYDSAGVAILDQGHFRRIRAEGKLSNLESKLSSEKFTGHLGIGHTRWATHGRPSERNAHPHSVGGLSIVHNGIIENYADLRTTLQDQGSIFESETDSELVAHLLACEVLVKKDLLEAVKSVLPKLRGAYSILAVWEGQPDSMVAFKNGPPLVVGLGEGEVLIASDIQAIVSYTKRVVYLEDLEIAQVSGQQVHFFTHAGAPVQKSVQIIDWSAEDAQKGGYPHFMLKEIFEQPRAVAAAIQEHIDPSAKAVKWTSDVLARAQKVQIVACGTSYYAGMYAKYLIEKWARIPTDVDIASEFRYRDPILSPDTLTLVISQSGETADTLAALRMVRASGGKVLSVCNVRKSSIDRESDVRLYMNAGPEVGVASTKAFTSTMALMHILGLSLAKSQGRLSREVEQREVEAILSAPSHMESVLNYSAFFAEAADILKKVKGFLYMGRGAHYPMALEGALKLKELAYMHAEGYAAGEMKHGPLALIDERMVVVMLAPTDSLYEKTVSNLEEAKARGAKIISLGTGHNQKLEALSDHYLALPEVPDSIYPIVEVLPLQLLAYHVAHSLGHDVDQPRNLAKSVTVE